MIRRRTVWFTLAFGSWGPVTPDSHAKDILTRRTAVGGWWGAGDGPPWIERAIWEDEETDPG